MLRVLIVDDEYIMRQGLKYIIDWNAYGYEIVGEAQNGEEALRKIEELSPHIVFTDIVMPTLNGVDFTEAVHKLYPSVQMIVLSGYDKFEYVKQTFINGVVDYILKPTLNPTDILRVLEKASSNIPGYIKQNSSKASPERSLARLILGHDTEPDAVLIEKLKGNSYVIYSADIRGAERKGTDMIELLSEKLDNDMDEYISETKVRAIIREQYYTVVFACETNHFIELFRKLENISNKLGTISNDYFAVLSREFYSLEDLEKIYKQDIENITGISFYYEGLHLIRHDQIVNGKDTENPRFDFFEFNQLIQNRQYAGALELLDQYNTAALSARMDITSLKNQIKNVLYHFIDSVSTENKDLELNHVAYFADINDSKYEKSYLECTQNIFLELKEILSKQQPIDERLYGINKYISDNYNVDLRLEDIAEKFGLNYNYLSTYFSQQMGENFSEYLTKIRIEKARTLLRNTNMSIAEVAESVGYLDQSYFARVFKKIVGDTPTGWRSHRP